MKHLTAGVGLVVLWAVGGAPLAADWLVMVDGSKVETLESWQVKKGMVVFKTPTGTLSSLRLSEVDLEASEAATVAAKQPPPPPPPPPEVAPPVMVLTTDDVGRGTPTGSAEEDAGREGAGDSTAPAEARPIISNTAVEVTSWENEPNIDLNGYALKGYVRNNGGEPVHNLKLEIELYDGDQKLLAKTVALLGATFLRSGGTTDFRANFQDTQDFVGDPRFSFTAEETPTVDRLELRVVDGRDAEDLFRASESNDDFDDADDFGDDLAVDEEDDDEGQ